MKIHCECGYTIVDQTDNLPFKGHIVPDENLFALLDAIDEAVEKSGPSAAEKEAACMRVRRQIGQVTTSAWQCRQCGTLYVDGAGGQLQAFKPAGEDVSHEVLAARRGTDPS